MQFFFPDYKCTCSFHRSSTIALTIRVLFDTWWKCEFASTDTLKLNMKKKHSTISNLNTTKSLQTFLLYLQRR